MTYAQLYDLVISYEGLYYNALEYVKRHPSAPDLWMLQNALEGLETLPGSRERNADSNEAAMRNGREARNAMAARANEREMNRNDAARREAPQPARAVRASRYTARSGEPSGYIITPTTRARLERALAADQEALQWIGRHSRALASVQRLSDRIAMVAAAGIADPMLADELRALRARAEQWLEFLHTRDLSGRDWREAMDIPAEDTTPVGVNEPVAIEEAPPTPGSDFRGPRGTPSAAPAPLAAVEAPRGGVVQLDGTPNEDGGPHPAARAITSGFTFPNYIHGTAQTTTISREGDQEPPALSEEMEQAAGICNRDGRTYVLDITGDWMQIYVHPGARVSWLPHPSQGLHLVREAWVGRDGFELNSEITTAHAPPRGWINPTP